MMFVSNMVEIMDVYKHFSLVHGNQLEMVVTHGLWLIQKLYAENLDIMVNNLSYNMYW